MRATAGSAVADARRRLVIVVVGASLLGATVLGVTGWLGRQPGFLFEVLFYPTLAAVLASSEPIRSDILALPLWHRRFLLGLVAVAVTAQFMGGGGELFPGARWAMFSDPVPNAVSHVLVVDYRDGHSALLDPADLFGSLRNGRAGSLLGRLAPSDSDALLRAYASRLEASDPGVAISAIRLVEVTVVDDNAPADRAALVTVLEVRP
jgi:hypothetical protein